MFAVFGIGATMIRFDVIDSTQVAFLIDAIDKPGATFDIIFCVRIHPGCVKFVAWPKVEGFDPCQNVRAPKLSPTFQILITDAPIVRVDKAEATLTATAAVKG
jgi:hypothetical protein